MKYPGMVDVIAVEVGVGWVGRDSTTDHWSHFTGHASPLSTCCC